MPIGMTAPDPIRAIERDCALFYGELGAAAEQYCRIQMRQAHALPAPDHP